MNSKQKEIYQIGQQGFDSIVFIIDIDQIDNLYAHADSAFSYEKVRFQDKYGVGEITCTIFPNHRPRFNHKKYSDSSILSNNQQIEQFVNDEFIILNRTIWLINLSFITEQEKKEFSLAKFGGMFSFMKYHNLKYGQNGDSLHLSFDEKEKHWEYKYQNNKWMIYNEVDTKQRAIIISLVEEFERNIVKHIASTQDETYRKEWDTVFLTYDTLDGLILPTGLSNWKTYGSNPLSPDSVAKRLDIHYRNFDIFRGGTLPNKSLELSHQR